MHPLETKATCQDCDTAQNKKLVLLQQKISDVFVWICPFRLALVKYHPSPALLVSLQKAQVWCHGHQQINTLRQHTWLCSKIDKETSCWRPSYFETGSNIQSEHTQFFFCPVWQNSVFANLHICYLPSHPYICHFTAVASAYIQYTYILSDHLTLPEWA